MSTTKTSSIAIYDNDSLEPTLSLDISKPNAELITEDGTYIVNLDIPKVRELLISLTIFLAEHSEVKLEMELKNPTNVH